MKTILVNGRHVRFGKSHGGAMVVHRRKRRSVKRRRAHRHNPSPVLMMNPTHRRRASTRVVYVSRRRRHHRNPLILPNRGHRRRHHRRNGFSLWNVAKATVMGAAGGGGAYIANKFALSKLGVDSTTAHDTPNGRVIRIAVRLIAGGLGAYFLPGLAGKEFAGGLGYINASEIDDWMHEGQVATGMAGATPTQADLSDFEADLSDVLDGY